jgi:periplasmic protein CpxP/Spy
MMRTKLPFVLAILVAWTSVAAAQRGDSGIGRRGARVGGVAAARGAPGTAEERQALQRRVREAFSGVVRRTLKLDAAQMQTLLRVDQKFQQQRRALQRDEREARLGLRAAMQDSTARDQEKIARYLDGLIQGQRRRADLLDAEQKELATFLTPLQRAQYFALRERMDRRLQEMEERRGQAPESGRGLPPPFEH